MEAELSGPHMPMFVPNDCLPSRGDKQRLKPNVWDDMANVILLIFLYTLQAVPLGLTASISLVLQNHHVSYKQQALFSFAHWPFSLKLLWAPIVDSLFSVRFGRRKSWLIPTQYLIGLFMLLLSVTVDGILTPGDGLPPDLVKLTLIFFLFNFLAATQDIVVDGWALTILSAKNVGYASTCNVIGQTAGYFLGNVVFLSLESKDFCNKYLRSAPVHRGLVTLSEYLYFWAFVFLVSTTLVWLCKSEGRQYGTSSLKNVARAYRQLLDIVRLRPVITIGCVYLTAKIAFAAADGITALKLIELGVAKDQLALLAVPIVPLELVLPVLIAKYTAGPRPLNVFMKAYPYRNVMGILFGVLVYWTPGWRLANGQYPISYYGLVLLLFALQQVTAYCMFVSQMAFHAQISDPSVGGTYMTMLNTMANLGSNWPVTVALSVVDSATYSSCAPDQSPPACYTLQGYYLLLGLGVVFGFAWSKVAGKIFLRLQNVEPSQWLTDAT